jgi:CsoR family transcriptional regulator, copper-sensing transcriptional repressor
LKRLNYASGHLEGIKRMTQDDRYCVDILKQSYAVRRALEKIEALILEGHLTTCVVEGIQSGDTSEVIRELLDLFEQSGR